MLLCYNKHHNKQQELEESNRLIEKEEKEKNKRAIGPILPSEVSSEHLKLSKEREERLKAYNAVKSKIEKLQQTNTQTTSDSKVSLRIYKKLKRKEWMTKLPERPKNFQGTQYYKIKPNDSDKAIRYLNWILLGQILL